MSQRNLAASVRAKLRNKARADNKNFTLILTRFALERLLYRLGISEHAEHFLLKGALLFDLWFDIPRRPTRDIDLLGFGPADEAYLAGIFQDLCNLDVEDGITFDSQSIRTQEIRKEANYAGIRITLLGRIDGARCPVQIDVGYGDAVVPNPELVEYPAMLDEFPAPRLKVYSRYSVVAEKLEALISLGAANSRMKDYFDLWVLAEHSDFEGNILCNAIAATLRRRGTNIPIDIPFGLSAAFAADIHKQMQWQGFLNKNRLNALKLEQIITELRHFLLPPLNALADGHRFTAIWQPKDWHSAKQETE